VRLGIKPGERSISLDGENADTLYGLALVYMVAGQTSRSMALLRQCIDINRNHAPAYFLTGNNLVRSGRARECIEWVERAFALSPREPLRSVWHSIIARAYFLLGEDQLAIEAAESGFASNPDYDLNHAILASVYAHLGDSDRASAAVRELLRVQPDLTLKQYEARLTAGDAAGRATHVRLMEGLRIAGIPEHQN
jgi:tetratricopeptide (TPR) repeat protein